jgi:hypothetical protein
MTLQKFLAFILFFNLSQTHAGGAISKAQPIVKVARQGDLAEIKKLIETGFYVDPTDSKGKIAYDSEYREQGILENLFPN